MNLQYTDLVLRCEACNGSGYVYNPDWRDVDFAGWTPAEIREFTRTHGNEELECGECDGTGERLTDAGEALYRAMLPMVQRAITAAMRRHLHDEHRATRSD